MTSPAARPSLNYVTWETESPRAVVVIVHGLAEHIGRYQWVGDQLADRGIAAIGADLRGHGQSEGRPLRISSFDEYVDDAAAMVAAAQEKWPGVPLFVLGHSMGGLVTFTAGAQGRLGPAKGVILSAPLVAPGEPVPTPLLAVINVVGRFAPGMPLQKLKAAQVSRDPEVVKAYDSDPLVNRSALPAGLMKALLAAMQQIPALAPGFELPVLIMHGSDDAMVDVDGSRDLVDQIGSADKKLTVYPGLFHEILNEPEKPTVLQEAVDFIEARL